MVKKLVEIEVEQQEEKLMTPKELALKLGFNPIWVYEQVRKGKIPAHRVGDRLRFDSKEIQEWLERNRIN